MAVLGDLLFRGSSLWKLLAGNTSTTRKFLRQTGDGTNSADPAWDQVTDADLATSDVTTNDVSITKHGFAPKAPNDTTKFLRGDGTWALPPAGGSLALDDLTDVTAPTPSDGDVLTFASGTSAWGPAAPSGGSGITQLTGDVTAGPGSGSQAATIASDAVTNAKLANMAQATIKGRASGAGTGDPTDLTGAQATAVLDAMVGDSGSGGTKGLVPAPAAGDSSAGKFLKADGTWTAPPSGGGSGSLVLLEQHTASSSSALNITAAISSTYDEYLIEILNLVPSSDGVSAYVQLSTDGGTSYDSGANSEHGRQYVSSNAISSGSDSSSTLPGLPLWLTDLENTPAVGLCATMRLFNPGSAAQHKAAIWDVYGEATSGNFYSIRSAGRYRSNTAVNALRVVMSSGDIASGTIRVYGVAK